GSLARDSPAALAQIQKSPQPAFLQSRFETAPRHFQHARSPRHRRLPRPAAPPAPLLLPHHRRSHQHRFLLVPAPCHQPYHAAPSHPCHQRWPHRHRNLDGSGGAASYCIRRHHRHSRHSCHPRLQPHHRPRRPRYWRHRHRLRRSENPGKSFWRHFRPRRRSHPRRRLLPLRRPHRNRRRHQPALHPRPHRRPHRAFHSQRHPRHHEHREFHPPRQNSVQPRSRNQVRDHG